MTNNKRSIKLGTEGETRDIRDGLLKKRESEKPF